MLRCVIRGHRGTGSHPRPCQADGQGGEDSRDQRRGSGLHPAGAGRHPFGQEEVSDRSLPLQAALTTRGRHCSAYSWHFSYLDARTHAHTHTRIQ